jgi:hypothetical protein
MFTLRRASASTVTVACVTTLGSAFAAAVIVAEPGARAVTSPFASTVATAAALVDQVTPVFEAPETDAEKVWVPPT